MDDLTTLPLKSGQEKNFGGTWYKSKTIRYKNGHIRKYLTFAHYVDTKGNIYMIEVWCGGSRAVKVDKLPIDLLINVEEDHPDCYTICGSGLPEGGLIKVPSINFVNHWLNNQYKHIKT